MAAENTFWITRQPYICRLRVSTWPSSLLASSLLWESLPCSKNWTQNQNYWTTQIDK